MMNFEIPDGLGDMLRDFTVAVLRERPPDLYDFAVDYFTKSRDSKKVKTIPMYVIVDDDDDAGEPDLKPKTQKQNRFGRRHSVSAERYDPEEDDDDGEERVVHPKTDEQRERLSEAVGGILLFKSLELEQMQEVIDAMFEKTVEPGEHVIEQGDDGDNFYVIDKGTFDVKVKTEQGMRKVHQFEEKGSFGELALMYNMPRSASVTAVTPGALWAMDRKSFRTIVLKSAFKKRKMYEKLLENVPMLKHLENYERMNLADALTSKTYPEDEAIIKECDPAEGMYFIENGTVRVTITKHGKEVQVSKLDSGQYFGEMALVENKPRSASVYSVGKVKVAFLERECFERLLGPCLDIMKRNIVNYKKSS
jgi:cAMP-dependent protein kinase regulator